MADRIASVTCAEHLRWLRPFITPEGRIANAQVWEGENSGLRDGEAPWRRVVRYWHESGLLGWLPSDRGAGACLASRVSDNAIGASCRGFAIDQPWSAVFVSWVMQRAGVVGFAASTRHFDYVRGARLAPGGGPFRLLDPAVAVPGPGDLLCYVRATRIYGFDGLAAAIDRGSRGLAMHCDIVVAADPDGDGKAYLIGGNVQQSVTMRILDLDASGRFMPLPRRAQGDPACSPDTAAACDLDRQDWAALLQLKPRSRSVPAAVTASGDMTLMRPMTMLMAAPITEGGGCVECAMGRPASLATPVADPSAATGTAGTASTASSAAANDDESDPTGSD